MNIKVIYVKDCLDCPYFSEDGLDSAKGWCKKKKKHLPPCSTIPTWCPLDEEAANQEHLTHVRHEGSGLEGTKIDDGSHRMSDGFNESEFGDYHSRR